MRNDFTLFYRVVPSGKKVVYYYAYDDEGNRRGPWSTGQVSKTAARNFCNLLNRQGKLLQKGKEMPTFGEYAKDFWDWEKSNYIKDRKKRRVITQNYTDKCKFVVLNSLTPYFGKMKLDKITGEVIDEWLDYMMNLKQNGKTKYKNKTINGYFGTLATMLKWAVRKKVILRDPFLDVDRLVNHKTEKKIITQDEFKELFVNDWKKAWDSYLIMCTANKLAALTGMRCSEILGLKGEYVFDNFLYLCGQFDDYGYRETKTKVKQQIPLPAELVRDLKKLTRVNKNGFVFSEDGGQTPITRRRFYLGVHRAFNKIGISSEEIKERGLNIHAWRHFCNTELLKGGMSVKKVQAVTGHKTEGKGQVFFTKFMGCGTSQ
jgi:integrase